LRDYHDLYTWSITNIDKFWSLVWDFTNIIGYKGNHVVDSSALPPSVVVRNIDSTNNSIGAIMYQVKVNMYYKNYVEKIQMDMCNLGKTNVILGIL